MTLHTIPIKEVKNIYGALLNILQKGGDFSWDQMFRIMHPLGHSLGSKSYTSRIERIVESFASTRDEA